MMQRPLWRRRAEVVLGVAAYLGLVALMALSALNDSGHVGFGRTRIRAAWSDVGVLITLLVAAPVVFWAAIVHWTRK